MTPLILLMRLAVGVYVGRVPPNVHNSKLFVLYDTCLLFLLLYSTYVDVVLGGHTSTYADVSSIEIIPNIMN